MGGVEEREKGRREGGRGEGGGGEGGRGGGGGSGRRHGGRDPRELHASRRVHLRQHVIHATVVLAAHVYGNRPASKTRKLLYLGSSCIYPREAAQPRRKKASDRSARSNQRVVCDRQDRGDPAVPSYRHSPAPTSSRRCRRTCTVRTTTSISRAAMCSCVDTEVPRGADFGNAGLSSGAAVAHVANSFTWTTWRTPVCS